MGGPDIDRSGYRRYVPGATPENPAPFGYYNDNDGELPFLRGLARTGPRPFADRAVITAQVIDAPEPGMESPTIIGTADPAADRQPTVDVADHQRILDAADGHLRIMDGNDPLDSSPDGARPLRAVVLDLAALLSDLLRVG